MPTVLARYGVVDREINFRTLPVRFVGERAPQSFPLCWMGMIRTPTRERIPGGDQVRLHGVDSRWGGKGHYWGIMPRVGAPRCQYLADIPQGLVDISGSPDRPFQGNDACIVAGAKTPAAAYPLPLRA